MSVAIAWDQSMINAKIDEIKQRACKLQESKELYKQLALKLIGLLDLTTLSGDDTPQRINDLVNKAANPLPGEKVHCAAICVYPARIRDAANSLKNWPLTGVKLASVAGGFPSGQYRLETRLLEIQLAIEDGAQEIDVVINRCAALFGDWQVVKAELAQMRQICGADRMLKVILASGELKTLENVYQASMIAMEAGCDFIKTSTGKETVNATLAVSWTMCHAIRNFYKQSQQKVGFKPAGGIKTMHEAVEYFLMVQSILGDEWLCPELFRIGASSLLDDLIVCCY